MKILLLLCGISILGAGALRERLTSLPPAPDDSFAENIPAGARRALAVGYASAIADLFWLDAIQYYGTPSNAEERFRRLPAIMDVVTDLDPSFDYGYQFIGQVGPYHDGPTKLWHNVHRTLAVVKRGIDNHPRRWEVPWVYGYDLFTFTDSDAEAGKALLLSASLADAGKREDEGFDPPKYLRSLALRLLAQGGALDVAIQTTTLALERETDERMRSDLEDRLRALELERELGALNTEAARDPTQARTLLQTATGPRLDPFGAPYSFDGARVHSHNEDHFLRLHIHPGASPREPVFD